AIAGTAAIVHIQHRKTAAGPVLDRKAQRRRSGRRWSTMTLHDQRWLFILRSAVIGILRWIKETVRGEPALSRKLDRARHRKVPRINFQIIRPAQYFKLARVYIKFHDCHDNGRPTTAKHRLPVCGPDELNVRIRTIDRRQLPALHIYSRKRRNTLIDVTTNNRLRRSKSVGRHRKDPLRHPQLSLRLIDIFDTAISGDSFEVPPATAIGREVQNPVR